MEHLRLPPDPLRPEEEVGAHVHDARTVVARRRGQIGRDEAVLHVAAKLAAEEVHQRDERLENGRVADDDDLRAVCDLEVAARAGKQDTLLLLREGREAVAQRRLRLRRQLRCGAVRACCENMKLAAGSA